MVLFEPVEIPEAVRQLSVLRDNAVGAPRDFLAEIPNFIVGIVFDNELQIVRQHPPQEVGTFGNSPDNENALSNTRFEMDLEPKWVVVFQCRSAAIVQAFFRFGENARQARDILGMLGSKPFDES